MLIVLFLPSLIYAQYAYYYVNSAMSIIPPVNDARARAMGRTEILSAGGANAMFYNPANLGFVESSSIEAGARGLFGSVSNDEWDQDDTDNISANYPLNLKPEQFAFVFTDHKSNSDLAALAFGYNTFIDCALKYKFVQENSTGSFKRVVNRRLSGGLHTLSVAAAIRCNNYFFIGVAAHKSIMSKLKSVANFDSTPYGPTSSKKNSSEYKLSAFFMTFGTTVKPINNLTIGLYFRPQFTITAGDYKYKNESYNGDIYTRESDSESKVKIPSTFGASISHDLSSRILAVVEYQYRPYNDIEVGDGYYIFERFESGSSYRFGLEYRMKTPVRIGYFNEALPAADESSYFKKLKRLNGFTAGVGFQSRYFWTDIYVEYAFWKHLLDTSFASDHYYERESFFSLGATFKLKL